MQIILLLLKIKLYLFIFAWLLLNSLIVTFTCYESLFMCIMTIKIVF